MSDIRPEPLFWLVAFTCLILLHLTIHPQSQHYRRALTWLSKNPAPLLLLATTHTLLANTQLWPGLLSHETQPTPLTSPLEQWLLSSSKAWQQLPLLYHHALIPIPVLYHPALAALSQALIAATSQIWLCRYLLNSLSPFVEDWLALRQIICLWPAILTLTLLYFPWWFLQRPNAPATNTLLQYLLLPLTLLLTAPIPTLLASGIRNYTHIAHLTISTFKHHPIPLLTILISSLLTLTLLHHTITHSQNWITGTLAPLRIISISLLASFLHLWIFLTTTFLILTTLHQQNPQSIPTPNPDK